MNQAVSHNSLVIKRHNGLAARSVVVVSKKVYPLAVSRNKAKRRVRALLRSLYGGKALFFVTIIKSPLPNLYSQLKADFESALKRSNF